MPRKSHEPAHWEKVRWNILELAMNSSTKFEKEDTAVLTRQANLGKVQSRVISKADMRLKRDHME